MCQSYSSMMFSISRASCWIEAPNWKNVDFTSCEEENRGDGGKGRREDKGRGRKVSVGVFVWLPLLVQRLIHTASQKYQSTTGDLKFGTMWVHTHTHTHTQVESYMPLVEEIYGWGPQNNSIKPKLDWCRTGRLQNSVGLVLGNVGSIHSESHISTPLNLTQNHLPLNSAKLRHKLGQSRRALLQVD